ncbi:MAG: response regulator [Bacteroidota bacterium]
MKKVRVLIVEDEFITLDTLREELEELGYEISGDAMKAQEALTILERGDTDIAILDIHLKGSESGIWLAEQIRKRYKIPFIFLSAFSDRTTIAEAAETQPSSYLVKPFTPADLYTAIEMALLKHSKHHEQLQLTDDQASVKKELLINDSIFVKDDLTYRKIPLRDICYVEAFKNYLELQLDNGRHIIRSTLKDFLEVLPQDHFVQTHRSFVINLERVTEIGGNFVVINDNKVPISRGQKEEVLARLNFYE